MLRLDHSQEGVSLGVLALFTSLGTLLCCALPILLVSVGLGSVVAAVTLQLPFLVTLSEYKVTLFTLSAILLALSAWLIWRKATCPADPALAARCQRTKVLGKRVFWVASSLWFIGLASAYLLLPLRLWLDL